MAVPPAVGTLWLELHLARKYRYGLLFGMLIGPLLRLPLELGLAAGIFLVTREQTDGGSALGDPLIYWSWVLFAYLTALVAETVVLVRAAVPGRGGRTLSEASHARPAR